jgi:hypothetical protein
MRAIVSTLTAAAALSAAVPVLANGVSYVSGGIGYTEAAAMQAEARAYPLNLIFTAGSEGDYLNGVKVSIKDSSGAVVLDTVSEGPVMLVMIPTGTYRIAAASSRGVLARVVQVTAGGYRRVDFHWR